ncbi:MAG: TonB-dependent hemoglobin/transferrin/lactoferrin family receptor, partial [Cyanobacteria bacterium J06635_15]
TPAVITATPTPPAQSTSLSQVAPPNHLAQENTEVDPGTEADVTEVELGDTLRITVTGTRNPTTVDNVPATVTVFELEDFEFYQVQNLQDLLRYEPGVSVRNNLRYGAQDVNIRGIEGNRVLFQIDNIRLPERFEFGPFNIGRADYVDFATLQAVEVLRGPASTLYGSDALGGVVSYRSLEPSDLLGSDDNFAADFSTTFLSATGGFENIARAAFRQDQSEVVFVISRRDGREADSFAESQFVDSLDREGTTLYGNLVHGLNEFSRLGLIVEDFNRRTSRTESAGNLGTLNLSESEDILIDRTRLSLSYEYDNPESPSFLQFLRTQLFYQSAVTTEQVVETRASGSGILAGQPVIRNTDNQFISDSYGGEVQLRSDFATGSLEHNLTYGFDISNTFNSRPRDRVQTSLTTGVSTREIPPDIFPVKDFPDGNTLRLGIYLQDEIEMGDLSVIAGLRFDYYDLTTSPDFEFSRNGAESVDLNASALSPRIGLRYDLTPEISFYGQYARGFRAPLYSEINSGFTNLTSPFFKYETLSNPDLEPETSNSFEIGVRGNFSQFNFGITGFYNTYNNFIQPNTDAGTRCLVAVNPCPTFNPPISFDTQEVDRFQTQNISSARIYGVEVSGEYRFSPEDYGFSILGSLAYTVGEDLTANQPLTTIDPFTAVMGLRYRSPENIWRAELISTLVGTARVPNGSTTFVPASYAVFDLIGSYNVTPNLGFNLGIYNLLNAEYYNYSEVRTQPANSPDIARFSQPGTNVRLGVSFNF